MSDADGRGHHEPSPPHASEDANLSSRLHDLDRRLGKTRSVQVESAPRELPKSPGMAMALRLGADFVAGVIVGSAIGWGIDRLFGTSPWGLIVFLLLGFAAGVLTVMRSAGLIAKRPAIDDTISRRTE